MKVGEKTFSTSESVLVKPVEQLKGIPGHVCGPGPIK
jgi:hypothetical protein